MPTSTPLLPDAAGITSQAYVPWASGPNGGDTSIDTLTLEGGMTAGWGNNDGQTANPSLPTNNTSGAAINAYGGQPNWPISRVGLLRNVPGSLAETYTLYFLYNPNEVDVAFTVDQSQMPANYLFSQGVSSGSSGFNSATTAAPITAAQTVSWTLLFDRTYDMLYDSNPDGNRGVLKDVGALYLLMGTFTSVGAVPMSTLCEVVFGQTDNGDIWGFTGFISGAQITYPIFRHNMIPSRAQVGLSMTALYVAATPPPGSTTSSAATSVSATTSTIGTTNIPNPNATLGFT